MSDWDDIAKALGSSKDELTKLLQSDKQLKAFTTSEAIDRSATFGIKSNGSDNTLLIEVTNGSAKVSTGTPKDALFTLSALPEQWEQHFKETPAMPYQSYWGMFGMNIKQEGIEVLGDQTAFAQWTHVWRRVLELAHEAHCGPLKEEEQPEQERDYLTGRYVFLDAPVWGRSKVFYETSGEGKQQIVFLHTAGSDSRQYHGVMNDPQMRKKCTMFAFDLPGHGRSFPTKNLPPGAHTNTEDSYVGIIAAFVKELGLRRPIICGASMAGQVCLAVAIRHKEVGAGGTIPLQGSVSIEGSRTMYSRRLDRNTSTWTVNGTIAHRTSTLHYTTQNGFTAYVSPTRLSISADYGVDDVTYRTEGQQGSDLASLQCASLRRTYTVSPCWSSY